VVSARVGLSCGSLGVLCPCWAAAVLVTALACSVGAAETAAPSDAVKQQVRGLIREAGQKMDRGDLAGAAAQLEQARALWNEPTLDYNLGTVYGDLGQHSDAAHALARFLKHADRSVVTAERIDDAEKRLKDYERTLGRLSVRASGFSGAAEPSLFLDGTFRSKLPSGVLPPPGFLFTTPGSHGLRVSLAGSREYAVTVETRSGELRQVDLELFPVSSSEATLFNEPEKTPSQPEGTPYYKRWWFWTAVAGGTAIVLGVVGAAAAGSFDRTAPGSILDPIDVAR